MSKPIRPAHRSKRPLRVGVVSQYFWPELFPINGLVEGLAARGHQIEVLTGLPNYPGGRLHSGYGLAGPWCERWSGATVRRVPLVPRGDGSRWRLALNYVSYMVASVLSVPFFMRRHPPDVVLANQSSPLTAVAAALVLARLRRRPLAIWIQDLWPESLALAGVRSPALFGAMDRFMRLVYRSSDLVMIQSRAFRQHTDRYGFDARQVVYLPNWPDARFRPVERHEAAAEDAEMPQGFRILLAGNMGDAQALPSLLAAAELLRSEANLRIVIIGDGRMRRWLEREVARLELAPLVTYIGHRPVERMPFYYAASDALLISLRRDASLAATIPSRLQACLASRKAIIAALDGEAQRIVRDAGAGLVVPAEDPHALAEAIRNMLLSSVEDRERMADAALRYAQAEFDRETIVGRLEDALYSLLSLRP